MGDLRGMMPLTLATLAAATVLCYTGHLTGEAWAKGRQRVRGMMTRHIHRG